MTFLACTTCGTPLTIVSPPPGTLTPAWGHAALPADGHLPGIPPVIVTYRRNGMLWDADCAEVPGFPVLGAASLNEAKTIAWALLGKIAPPRPVAERYPEP